MSISLSSLYFSRAVSWRSALGLVVILFWLVGGQGNSALANNGVTTEVPAQTVGPEVPDADAAILKKQLSDLQIAINTVTATIEEISFFSAESQEQFKEWSKEFNGLTTLYQLSRSNPQQVDDVTIQMTVLTNSLTQTALKLQKYQETVELEREHFKILQQKLKEQLQQKTAESCAEDINLLRAKVKELAAIDKKLQTLGANLTAQLKPVKELSEQVLAATKEIQEQLPSLWRKFYLTHNQALFSPKAYAEVPQQMENWWDSLEATSKSIIQQPYMLLSMGLKCFYVFSPLAFLLLFIERRRVKSSRPYPIQLRRIYRISLPLLALAAACYYASWRGSVDFFLPLALVGHCFWLWGFVSLAWGLRGLYNQRYVQIAPFIQLLIPCFIGIVLLFLALPVTVLSLLWLFLMVGNLFWAQQSRKKKTMPPFERVCLKMAMYVYLVSLVGTTIGWINLCIAGVVLFTGIVVNLQLAIGLTKVVSTETTENASDLSRPGNLKALIHAIRMALGTPLSWLVACLALIPWFTVLPGTAFIFRGVVETKVIIGSLSISFARIFFILFIFYMTHAAIIVGRSFVAGITVRAKPLERGLVAPLQTALTYTAWCVFGLLTLNALGLNLMSIAVIAGGLSVGLGFGLQTIFNNFISGILLIFGRSLLEGDVIQLGETWGTVKKITVRSTMVETFDNAMIFVPNSELISQRLTNWTNNNRTIRRDIPLRVAYGSKMEEVECILMEVAEANKHVLYFPQPRVFLQNFSPTAIEVTLRVWIDDLDNMVSTPSELRFAIEREFAEAGIEIPVVPVGVESGAQINTTATAP